MLGRSDEWVALGVTPVAVGFSPPRALADLADHLGWPFLFCADEDRALYRRLGLGSAGPKDIFTGGTRAIYAAARDRGDALARPVEDARQLGGDALVNAGVTTLVYRPASPDDRPSVHDLMRSAAAP